MAVPLPQLRPHEPRCSRRAGRSQRRRLIDAVGFATILLVHAQAIGAPPIESMRRLRTSATG